MKKLSVRTRRHRWLAGALTALTMGAAVVAAPSAAVGESSLPGMCNGRSDAGVTVDALATGAIKYRLNVSTDEAGRPTGSLNLGTGPARIRVNDLCRLWQHIPGQPPGEDGEEDLPEGATMVHVVGTSKLPDGTPILVRTDIRALANHAGSVGPYGETVFRVRYRPLEGHDDLTGAEDEEGWIRVPAEGWAPLNRFNLRVFGPSVHGEPTTTVAPVVTVPAESTSLQGSAAPS